MVDVRHNIFLLHHFVCGSFWVFFAPSRLSQFMTHLTVYLCAHPIESFCDTLFGKSDGFFAAIN